MQAVLKLFTNPNRSSDGVNPGVMIPIPQYPLYSASLAEYNIDQVKDSPQIAEKNRATRKFICDNSSTYRWATT